MSEPSLVRFRSVVASALAHLESRRQEINDLNVFPVADGDTGDNMVLTLRAVLAEIDRVAAAAEELDGIAREEIVDSVARAALLGARGNSGVILSQLIRGAAEELASRPGELVDPVLIGAAMARAAERAYNSVREPAEGTILTVIREMAHRVAGDLAHMEESRLARDASDEEQDASLAAILERAVQTGEQSVNRGPELLAVLRDSGVVDAGGYGLVVVFAGIIAALRGSEPPELEHHAPAKVSHPQHSSQTYRYCTNFAVTGSDLEAAPFQRALEELGDSILVVGDRATLKVHVHTDDPEAATAVFEGHGAVSHLDVADMNAQVEERSARLVSINGGAQAGTCAVLAVVTGDGLRELYEGFGAHTLDGGPTLNPSTYDLLTGIHAVPAEQVVVLPNSPNVRMAADRAAELSEKEVRVVPTTSQQAGLAITVALDPDRTAGENATAMEDALGRVRTGAVAPAARDDKQGRFTVGDAVGFVGDEIVAWGDASETLRAVVAALGEGAELVTCLAGEDAPVEDREVAGLAPDGLELELGFGGQPSYWWLLSAE